MKVNIALLHRLIYPLARISNICLLALTLFVVAGCASKSPQKQAFINSLAAKSYTPPQCDNTNCDLYWARAVQWVSTYSQYKIQTQSDLLIQTYGPGSEMALAFRVNRMALSNSVYAISMVANCGNPFGCFDDPEAIKGAFYHYVKTGEDLIPQIPK